MSIREQDPKKIRFLTIHCSATRAGQRFTAAQISGFGTQRFGQPSYHHVVELDGRSTQVLRDDQIGAHTAKNNTDNIGVCYVGGLTLQGGKLVGADTRTPDQKLAIRAIVNHYKRLIPGIIVRGHRDCSPDRDGDGKIEKSEWFKECPCFDVATEL